MKTLEQKIEVMKAALDGKIIEFYDKSDEAWRVILGDNGMWTLDDEEWNWKEYDYRIKQEPMEFWVNVYEPNTGICYGFHETKSGAASGKSHDCIKTIKVREVIE